MIKSRRMRWVGHVAYMGDMRNAYRILVGEPEGKRPLRRPRHRQGDDIKIYLREIKMEGINWIHLAQDKDWWWAPVNMVMNLPVPQKAGNFLTS
jgi:hypothetical protein